MSIGSDQPREDAPQTIPIKPALLGIKIEYVEVPEVNLSLTFIGRRFDKPEFCRLCPPGLCNSRGGFCLIRVGHRVPEESCAGFALSSVLG